MPQDKKLEEILKYFENKCSAKDLHDDYTRYNHYNYCPRCGKNINSLL